MKANIVKIATFFNGPHPYMLASMALGILVNDSQFPTGSRHWVMDAMAILSGTALMLVSWKKDPDAAVPPVSTIIHTTS